MEEIQSMGHDAERMPITSARPFLTDVMRRAWAGEIVIITEHGKERCAVVSLAVAVAGVKALARQE